MSRTHDCLPRDFEEWLACLREACRCHVTPEFVAARIAVLSDRDRPETRAFIEAWGDAHLRQVLTWFSTLQRRWLQ